MTDYTAPVTDTLFALKHVAGLGELESYDAFPELSEDLAAAILEEAGKLAGGVFGPLNRQGDEQGAKLNGTDVSTVDGWKDAYNQFVEGGWNGLPFEEEFGGMGLPWVLNGAVGEYWHASNMSFALCPMLTQGAVEALDSFASDELKAIYLPNMVSGTWTGTMNLTEPQAGSDLAAIRTKAVPQGDGTYRISGQKIFITYGDHDMTDNIVHLVLGRTPDAPEGVKGISLFIVPKFMVNEDGSLGERNDAYCTSIEHKLGIHASPTAVMSFGDNEGAIGYLVGEENRGLEYMFVMMNRARLFVGLQGLGIADRAYQQALAYAKERTQGRPAGKKEVTPIIGHPDVRRMLMSMKSRIEAMRALGLRGAAAVDKAACHPDEELQAWHQQEANFLTPVVKGWLTENANDIASLGVQIHGGMGYVEETGAAQHFRDARITNIYEGTTAIQSNALVGRSILRDGGAFARDLIQEMKDMDSELEARSADPAFASMQENLRQASSAMDEAVDQLLAYGKDAAKWSAASVPFLHLCGITLGGASLIRQALAAAEAIEEGDDNPYLTAKIQTTRFYAEHILPEANLQQMRIEGGVETLLSFDDEQF